MDKVPGGRISVFGLIGWIYTVLGGLFFLCGVLLLMLTQGPGQLTGAIFAGIGGLFLLLGLVFLFVEWGKRRRRKRLIATGRYLWGEIVDWTQNPYVTVGHRHPWIFGVRYVDGRGVTHIFKSEGVQTYPDSSLRGKRVKVYIGDDQFRRYYVDLSGVLPRVVEH